MAELVVINTGPLIAFERMGILELPGRLPFRFVCPVEVRNELDAGQRVGYPSISPSWLTVKPLRRPLSPLALSALDRGEAAVIQLAAEVTADWVCIDEWKGRRAALAAGLKVTGVLGVLGVAKRQSVIPCLRPLIDKAVAAGIRYDATLVMAVLNAAGE